MRGYIHRNNLCDKLNKLALKNLSNSFPIPNYSRTYLLSTDVLVLSSLSSVKSIHYVDSSGTWEPF